MANITLLWVWGGWEQLPLVEVLPPSPPVCHGQFDGLGRHELAYESLLLLVWPDELSPSALGFMPSNPGQEKQEHQVLVQIKQAMVVKFRAQRLRLPLGKCH